MRTVDEIKKEMVDEYTSNETVRARYGVRAGEELSLAKASIENILFYVIAHAIWVLERLFGEHKTEVETYISEMKPHSLRWYVNKARAFRFGQSLIEDTDQYDDTGLTDEAIADMQIVKYASAEERNGQLFIKVAKDGENGRTTLSSEEEAALKSYIQEVKDAGVKVTIRNAQAVDFKIDITIYYNPQVLDQNGVSLISGGEPVKDAIKNYIENLPFNGEYRNVELIDKLQQVEGVVIPELAGAYSRITNEDNYSLINAKETSYSGYYKFDNDSQINYVVYENL